MPSSRIWPLRVLAVGHELLGILRRVELPHRRVDPELLEHALHAEGAGFVRHDGHHVLADGLVAHQHLQHPHQRHGGRDRARTRSAGNRLEIAQGRGLEPRRPGHALRHEAAQPAPALLQVADLLAVLVERAERNLLTLQRLVADRQIEPVAELAKRVKIQLLGLVGGHPALAALAHPEALHGLGQDYGGPPLLLRGALVGRVDLHPVVPAPVQQLDVFGGHVRHLVLEPLDGAEEFLAGVLAAQGLAVLVLAVHAFLHAPAQQAVVVAGQERVPARPPDRLDHVPAGAQEGRFQLLDDLAVAAHRAVEALQVAIDHEDQVVQTLAHRHRDSAQRFRLVHFAVAQHAPHAAVAHLGQAAVLEVAHEARLEDRHHGAQAHGNRRELPEVRHQPGMRIRRQPPAAHLLAETGELLVRKPAFEKGPGVDAGRGMALEIHQVAAVLLCRRAPEVVEAHFVQRRRGRVGGDMPAVLGTLAVGVHHHRHGVPADVVLDPALQRHVARVFGLVGPVYRVEVGGVGGIGHVRARAAGAVGDAVEQKRGAFGTLGAQDGVDRLQPLAGFQRVAVVEGIGAYYGVVWHTIRPARIMFLCSRTSL